MLFNEKQLVFLSGKISSAKSARDRNHILYT